MSRLVRNPSNSGAENDGGRSEDDDYGGLRAIARRASADSGTA